MISLPLLARNFKALTDACMWDGRLVLAPTSNATCDNNFMRSTSNHESRLQLYEGASRSTVRKIHTH